MHLRLVLYKRVAAAANVEELRELQVEMIDRFGLLPPPAKNLFRIPTQTAAARALGLRKIDVGPGGGSVTFGQETQVEPATLIRYVQRNSRTHRLEGGVKLRFVIRLEKDEQRFAAAEELLPELAKKAGAEAVRKRRSGVSDGCGYATTGAARARIKPPANGFAGGSADKQDRRRCAHCTGLAATGLSATEKC